ncbi:hypothetical protein T492DRAFT_917126 [Pavlovales sp. CCMP2436]|nr:hypothetical protein T492DRAFT_917126 [Pavlovales sp. CCMP2436]
MPRIWALAWSPAGLQMAGCEQCFTRKSPYTDLGLASPVVDAAAFTLYNVSAGTEAGVETWAAASGASPWSQGYVYTSSSNTSSRDISEGTNTFSVPGLNRLPGTPDQPHRIVDISLILARARSLHTQTARAAAGARGTPWFQRTGRSANGPEDAPAHADGAYRNNNWRSHNADRGARLGRGDRGGRGGQGTRT